LYSVPDESTRDLCTLKLCLAQIGESLSPTVGLRCGRDLVTSPHSWTIYIPRLICAQCCQPFIIRCQYLSPEQYLTGYRLKQYPFTRVDLSSPALVMCFEATFPVTATGRSGYPVDIEGIRYTYTSPCSKGLQPRAPMRKHRNAASTHLIDS
jgi:hypothetical protein